MRGHDDLESAAGVECEPVAQRVSIRLNFYFIQLRRKYDVLSVKLMCVELGFDNVKLRAWVKRTYLFDFTWRELTVGTQLKSAFKVCELWVFVFSVNERNFDFL